MTHLYDMIEPNVISEALLQECVGEQGPDGEAGRLAKEEGLDFSEVTELRLDFKNILRIENMWQFHSLQRLQLDNNIIEVISGLDSLPQLEWLDLSFNNIEVITGLEKLVSLRDLSLAHNRIRRVEHLDSLQQLQVLSLSSNLMEELDNVKYLRQFKYLQSLALKGNPLASSERYEHFIVAYIPSLHYLDFRMILDAERHAAREAFQEALEELEMHERDIARRQAEQEARCHQEELYKDAYVDGLQGSVLYESLFAEDVDAERLSRLPDVQSMLEKFQERCVECCEHLTKVGLDESAKRQQEQVLFTHSHKEACSANQELSVLRVREYEALKQKLAGELVAGGVRDEVGGALRELHHDLMRLEMQLVEQLDEITKDFERNYSDMVEGFLEQVQSHMTQLRELEGTHHERVTEIALAMLERFVKNQLEDDELADELRILFVDKDTLVGAINAAHDTHTQVIDNKEDSILQQAKRDKDVLLGRLSQEEQLRNRQRVVELEQYIAHQHEELDGSDTHPD